MPKIALQSQKLSKFAVAVAMVLSVLEARAGASDGLDFSTTVLARTYSPALSINPKIGVGHRFWGDSQTPWYGFIRPYAVGVLSPSLYEGKFGIEFFPISILGLDLKRTTSRRFNDTKGIDCSQNQCQGLLEYTDFSLQSYLGGGGYFSSIRWTRTFFDAVSDKLHPVYDLGAAVLLKPDGDSGDFLTIALGREFHIDGATEKFSAGFLFQTADFHYSGQRQEGQYAIVRSNLAMWGLGDFDATVGVGRFKSSLNVGELSAILSLTYTHTPAIGFGR